MKTSKTQINQLGYRFKNGSYNESDLKILDEYRRSFRDAYENTVHAIHDQLNISFSGRPSKSTASLIGKLQRESIRLSQVQDIAGCRIIVTDIIEQNTVVNAINNIFSNASIVDRRPNPSHGYRAVNNSCK